MNDHIFRELVLKEYEVWPPGYYRCAVCGRPYTQGKITVGHIKSRGANRELNYERLNAITMCDGFGTNWCHTTYENKTEDEQRRAIEKILPGRWAELEDLKRACYV